MARMKHQDRKALAARRRAFRETQPSEPAVMELSERVALHAKAAVAPPENKALAGPPENKGDALAGVQFASPVAEKKARRAKLRAAQFVTVTPSGKTGYTAADVRAVAEKT